MYALTERLETEFSFLISESIKIKANGLHAPLNAKKKVAFRSLIVQVLIDFWSIFVDDGKQLSADWSCSN